ncbi:MAG: hypothetical protein CM15mV50_270 [uncultured marine virus]|nr:MAG: hypothetical protein CM15mV50_270 [uncultured marine virus]
MQEVTIKPPQESYWGSFNVGGTNVIDTSRNLVNMGNVNGAAGIFGSLEVDDITINGSTISDAADITLDVGGDIILDADGGDVIFRDGGTSYITATHSSGDVVLTSNVDDKDIIFKGYDSGSLITALTLICQQQAATLTVI